VLFGVGPFGVGPFGVGLFGALQGGCNRARPG